MSAGLSVVQPGSLAPALAGQPVFGLPFDLSRAIQRGPVVVAFWSGLSNAGTLANLAALSRLWPTVDSDGGGMVAITRSPMETARDFVPRHHVLFPVLVDESGELCARWGVGAGRGIDARLVRARPAPLRRLLSVVRNGHPLPESHADQLPAAFAIGPDGRVRYAWVGEMIDARIDERRLWAAACASA